jgi:predicted aspartyl protease
MRQERASFSAWCLQALLLAAVPLQVSAAPADVASGSGPEAGLDPLLDPELFASPTRADHIGRILVPVLINGRGPFRMVVDTGASQSTISPRAAGLLGLTSVNQPSVRVNGITGTAELPSVAVDRLQCGDFVLEHVMLPVVWAPVMSNADGILGVGGLTKHRLLVDFQHNRVSLAGTRSALPDFLRVPAKRLDGGLFTVAARIGGVKVTAIIDTGSQRTLGNLALRDALLANHRHDAKPEMTTVYGATTDVSTGEMALAPPISLGTVTIDSVTVVYGDFHIFEVWNLATSPAVIIGMDVLGTVRALAIDFARSELYFKSIENGPNVSHGMSMAPNPLDHLASAR